MRPIVIVAALLVAAAPALSAQQYARPAVGHSALSSDPATCGDLSSVCSEWTLTKAPAALASNATPTYPVGLRSNRTDGAVEIEFIIGADGRLEPGSIQLLSSSNERLTKAVMDIAPGLRYTPGEVSGRAVRVLTEQTFTFAMQR
jgi:periplasmic protein TonB